MELKHCPSCGSSEIEVAGNKVHCRGCDVTFAVTPDGARVADVDPLHKDRQRLDKIEQDVAELKKAKGKKGDIQEQESEGEADEEDGGIIKFTDDEPGKTGEAGDTDKAED